MRCDEGRARISHPLDVGFLDADRAQVRSDVGSFFLIAFWLIAASTATGLLLMHWVRTWHTAPTAAVEGAAT